MVDTNTRLFIESLAQLATLFELAGIINNYVTMPDIKEDPTVQEILDILETLYLSEVGGA